ncbi:hypothetical protein [Streptosporangium sp. NPDC048865]|uniref:hypothetical protein n=1 Tax=Streptosporangium sp. NPDC048865 TaxID=3155766 RepID=UPI003419B41D
MAGDNPRYLDIARWAATLRRPDDPAATQLMFEYLAGTAATFDGRHREAADPLRRVLELAPSVRTPSVLVWAGVSSLLLGDDAQATRLCGRAVETARARGAVSTVPQVLEFMIHADLWMGRYASITASAVEGLRLAQERGRPNSAGQHLGWLALTAAVEGDAETCAIRAASAIELAGAHGVCVAGALGNWAMAHLDLAAGRHADAAKRLRAMARADGTNGHLVMRVMSTPLFVEAVARTGDRERAGEALRVLDRWVGSTRSPVYVFGYPQAPHPDGDRPYSGVTPKYVYGKTSGKEYVSAAEKVEEHVGLKGAFTPGADGGPWISQYSSSRRLGLVNGVTSLFGDQDQNDRYDLITSPYFDGETADIYRKAANVWSGRIVGPRGELYR